MNFIGTSNLRSGCNLPGKLHESFFCWWRENETKLKKYNYFPALLAWEKVIKVHNVICKHGGLGSLFHLVPCPDFSMTLQDHWLLAPIIGVGSSWSVTICNNFFPFSSGLREMATAGKCLTKNAKWTLSRVKGVLFFQISHAHLKLLCGSGWSWIAKETGASG